MSSYLHLLLGLRMFANADLQFNLGGSGVFGCCAPRTDIQGYAKCSEYGREGQ